jgi:hypothetical protein
VSSGWWVVLSRFRSLAGCALALVFGLPGVLLLLVVRPVLSPMFRVALPPRVGPGLLPGWVVLAATRPGFLARSYLFSAPPDGYVASGSQAKPLPGSDSHRVAVDSF